MDNGAELAVRSAGVAISGAGAAMQSVEGLKKHACVEPVSPCLCIASLANSALLRHSYLWLKKRGTVESNEVGITGRNSKPTKQGENQENVGQRVGGGI